MFSLTQSFVSLSFLFLILGVKIVGYGEQVQSKFILPQVFWKPLLIKTIEINKDVSPSMNVNFLCPLVLPHEVNKADKETKSFAD